jgi:pimeloyl-ACP methyl ester carboxylesterase
LGWLDFDGLRQLMSRLQTDREAYLREALPALFKNPPPPEDAAWMLAEQMLPSPASACTILFNQTVADYRPILPLVDVPALLCFGGDEKAVPVAAGQYLKADMPSAELVVFEDSGHFPHWEESERFNEVVQHFLREL